MKRNELDNIFTTEVMTHIALGYVINLSTMNGSECGEIGKVDLRKGDDIIRVLLTSDRVMVNGNKVFKLVVGRNTDAIRGNAADNIWNEHLEVLRTKSWLVLNEGLPTEKLVEISSAEEVNKLCWDRLINRAGDDGMNHKFTSEAARAVALKYIKRQPRMSKTKLSDISQVARTPHGYTIVARGRTFTLC